MKLLLDLGNSRLKWATETRGRMSPMTAMDYRQPDFLRDLTRHWQALSPPKPDIVAVASVSAQHWLHELLRLSQQLWPQARQIVPRSAAFGFGVQNAYAQPEKLGIDRWLALIAAHGHYPGDQCVVDCGTAITADVLRADGSHRGGVIAPGLLTMRQALAANTADLPFNPHAYQAALARDTESAIAGGVLWAAVGLIEQVRHQPDADYGLIMTGGDAEVIAGALSIPALVDHALVLKGLSVFCRTEQGL